MNTQRRCFFILFLLLSLVLAVGLLTFRDYGTTPDEHAQVDAGHIHWRRICQTLGLPTPAFEKLPELEDYYNRYYGQAATLPTVTYEALRGFSLDISTIIRVRHLWNFLSFFAGLCCFTALVYQQYHDSRVCCAAVLMAVLFPRIFGDAFYNDRDVMLIAWLWIALAAFDLTRRKPSFRTALLCGLCCGMAMNVRLFALILLIPLIQQLIIAEKNQKKYVIWTFLFTLGAWYLFTPLVWGNPFAMLRDALVNFTTGAQRANETAGAATMLFMGRAIAENHPPFLYLPVWIIITTPPMTLLLCVLGLFRAKKDALYGFMAFILIGGQIIVGLVHPTLYNGWRHFYFLYIPLIWFAVAGFKWLLHHMNRTIKIIGLFALTADLCLTGIWMARNHPYNALYFTPFIRSAVSENFDRDYWRLSTRECLEFILQDAEEGEISIGEYNGSLDNTLIGLLPEQRGRFWIQTYFSYHRDPIEYLIFNYSNSRGNDKTIPLYQPIYSVFVDGFKLAEVFRRDHSKELYAENICATAKASIHPSDAVLTADGAFQSFWTTGKPQNSADWLELELNQTYLLHAVTLLPGPDDREYARTPELSVSLDGEHWEVVPIEVHGLLDLTFAPTEVRYLRIRNTAPADVNWSIKELLFYGHPTDLDL